MTASTERENELPERHGRAIWQLEPADLRTVRERSWTDDNFTESRQPYADLQTLCQIRQLTLETLESLSDDELGYIAGGSDVDERLLGDDPLASKHTSVTRRDKLRGNAERARLVLDHRQARRLARRAWWSGLAIAVVSVVGGAVGGILVNAVSP